MNVMPSRPVHARIFVNTVGFLDISPFNAAGCRTEVTAGWSYRPCDIAIMYGLMNPPRTSLQGALRNAIHRDHRGPIVVIESSIVGRSFTPRDSSVMDRLLHRARRPRQSHPYFRVGLNGALGDDADFGAVNSPPGRWEMMCSALGIEVRPYRSRGEHILVAGQVANDASLRGMDIGWWLTETAIRIRRMTDRPIVVRLHPSMRSRDSVIIRRKLALVKDVSFSPSGRQLRQDLENAWVCVTYSSGAAIDALIAGVPPICMSPASLAYRICSRSIDDIETPLQPDRTQFFNDLAYCQWSEQEMADGTAWRHIAPAVVRRLTGPAVRFDLAS